MQPANQPNPAEGLAQMITRTLHHCRATRVAYTETLAHSAVEEDLQVSSLDSKDHSLQRSRDQEEVKKKQQWMKLYQITVGYLSCIPKKSMITCSYWHKVTLSSICKLLYNPIQPHHLWPHRGRCCQRWRSPLSGPQGSVGVSRETRGPILEMRRVDNYFLNSGSNNRE